MNRSSSMELEPGKIVVGDLNLEYPIYSSVVGGRFAEVARSFLPFSGGNRKKVLDSISFQIEPGEGVGLVGVNGAGKTTLLKVISGLVGPTSGQVKVGGRVVALLAMGVGLRHHLTGRENIWFGGLLFGMSRREIESLIDEIIVFADLGSAIDQPYFTYSTGMRSRLGFALATSAPGDIYILDETLATGDVRFVAKCYERIRAIRSSGATVLFVSHNLGEIARMTKRVLVLDKGILRFDGDTSSGLQAYESIVHSSVRPSSSQNELIDSNMGLVGIDGLSAQVRLEDAQGEAKVGFFAGELVNVEIRLQTPVDLGATYVNLFVYEIETGTPVCYLSPDRWQSLGEVGQVQKVLTVVAGTTYLRGVLPALVLGEGIYGIDIRVEPVDPETGLTRDQTRTFRAATDLGVIYANARFKGAGTALEIPMKPWVLTHESFDPKKS